MPTLATTGSGHVSIAAVLVHLADDDACMARLRPALACARRFNATLLGVYTEPALETPSGAVGRAAAANYLRALAEVSQERAAAAEALFRRSCAEASVAGTWRQDRGEVCAILAGRLRYADLAFVSQTRPRTLEDLIVDYPPDHLPLAADGPVVVVPRGDSHKTFGETILVGWKPGLAAGRAVRGALPVLAAARRVHVLTVGFADDIHESGRDLVEHLGRHGIVAEPIGVRESDGDAGQVMLDKAYHVGADLIVSGAYSKPRLREIVFGGATRQLLAEMTVPVLMAH